ncbi:hypothetical protein [Chryseobacterium oryctis]|uniref:Lipoprotein n=1 Tax=Chryseobacterium oryctis TaxID=2952618 RepID=A0ABT3HNR4_9FLAO|nr:hypothetical protein [Chryseobacterium oryctis]MCW3161384.1 hypothetical protein [Chryseobacterium oryctis]
MKLVYYIFLLIILSCSDKDYNYILKSSVDPDNSYNIVMENNGNNLSVLSLYKEKIGGTEFYFLKRNGEFYSCDKSFSKDSIGKDVLLSTIKNYKTYEGDKYKGDSLIIKKTQDDYITMYKSIDYGRVLKMEYHYDKDYKVNKIIFNNIVYKVK